MATNRLKRFFIFTGIILGTMGVIGGTLNILLGAPGSEFWPIVFWAIVLLISIEAEHRLRVTNPKGRKSFRLSK